MTDTPEPEHITPDADDDQSLTVELSETDAGFDPASAVGGIDLDGIDMGGMDLGALMGAAQQMMGQMAEAQAERSAQVVQGSSGSGLVKISATGDGGFTSVSIAADATDPDDPTMLEDLILAALHDVSAQLAELNESGSPLGGMPGGLGSLDLGGLGLGGLLG